MLISINSRLTHLFGLAASLAIVPFGYGQPTIDPKIEGTYELTRTFHELSIRTIFVFSANGVSVPIISGKTVLPTSLDPNDDEWLDNLEDFAKNLNKTCADDLGNDATECAAGTVDVVQAIYDVNKWLVERMATEWNLDLLDFTPLDELLNLYPVNVVFTLSAGPVAMLKSDFTFDRPTTSTQIETTSNVFNTRINREGVFIMLALGLDNVQGGVSNGAAGLSFTYAYASLKGTILTSLDYDAKGEYDAGIGVAVGGTNFENLGIAVSLALTWAGDTEGEQTSFATSSPTTNAPTTDAPAPAPAPAPTPGSSNPPSSCFSRDATVSMMRNNEELVVVTMKDLKVGDKVLTGTSPDVYEPVYAFGHLHQTKTVSFRQIYTEGSVRPLELTGDHLVFVSGKSNPVRADSIKINDVLRTENEEQGARVVKVSSAQKSGIYAPLTPSGHIMVDGILASTYVSLQHHAVEFVEMKSGLFPSILSYHTYVHVGLSPFRIVCTKVSSSFCTRYDNDGAPYYAALAMRVNTWVHNQNSLVEVAAFLVLLFLACVSIVLECLLTFPTFLFLAVPLFVITIKRRFSLKINKKM